MKNLGFILFLFASMVCKAQTELQTELMYTGVAAVSDSASASELYLRAINYFTDKKGNIITHSVELLMASGRFSFKYEPSENVGYKDCIRGRVDYVLTVYCKKGRYKYELTYFRHVSNEGYCDMGPITEAEVSSKTSAKKYYNAAYKDVKDQILQQVKTIIAEISLAMDKKSPAETKW